MEQRTEQLQAIIAESALTEVNDFVEAVELAQKWEEEAKTIKVTDETQVGDMQIARSARLELRDRRIAVVAAHKEAKAESLKRGQGLDKVKRFVIDLITPIEKYLDEQEHFVEIKQKAEEEARQQKAEALLAKQEKEERQEVAEAAAEEARKTREENARLRKEAEEKEAARQQELQLIAEENARKDAAAKKETEEKEMVHKEALRLVIEEQIEKDAIAKKEADTKAEEERQKFEAQRKADQEEAAEKAAIVSERNKAEIRRVTKENEEREAAHKEAMRLARMMTCPNCGHEFDSEDGKK